MFAGVFRALPADSLPKRVVLIKFAHRRFELAVSLTDEPALAVHHQFMELMSGLHDRDATGQHRLHHCPAPGFLDPMAQRLEKNIQAVEEFQGGFLLLRQQLPFRTEPMPAILLLQIVAPRHDTITRLFQS